MKNIGKMGRTLVIGDIHNCYRGLKQALERAGLQKDDKIICLGDYFDGWSQAKEVLLFLLELRKTNECIFLRGNHDAWVKDWLTDKYFAISIFRKHGGQQTMDSFIPWFKEDEGNRSILLEFLKSLRYYHVEDNKAFMHAGFHNEDGVEFEDPQTLIWTRELVQMVVEMGISPKCLDKYSEVYVGHTPTLRYVEGIVPINTLNLYMMDTGAAFDGKVTVMDIDTKEIWQSDLVRSLYPNELGRNNK